MAIRKINNTTLRQQVYAQLRAKILGAELLPGQVISLRGLAESFGVSLVPVREAVWQLESEKIVIVESNKKVQVNHLTPEDLEEILDLRLMLESRACTKSCERRPTKAIPKVERILKEMEKYAGVRYKSYIKKNDQFHSTIYSYAASPMLMELIQRLLARVNPYVYIYSVVESDLSTAIECHREMFAGFADGDSERLITALHRDLQGAAAVILPKLVEQEQSGPDEVIEGLAHARDALQSA